MATATMPVFMTRMRVFLPMLVFVFAMLGMIVIRGVSFIRPGFSGRPLHMCCLCPDAAHQVFQLRLRHA